MESTQNASRVLVVETGSVLDEAIINLVMGESGLQVVTQPCNDPAAFLKEVSNVLPDVIVVSEAGEVGWTRISEILHGISPEEPLRLIVVRLDDNILEVYDKQCLKATHNDDLISLIWHR